MADLIEDGLCDEERRGEERGREEVELVEDGVGVGEDPRDAVGEGGRRGKVGCGPQVVLSDDCVSRRERSVGVVGQAECGAGELESRGEARRGRVSVGGGTKAGVRATAHLA